MREEEGLTRKMKVELSFFFLSIYIFFGVFLFMKKRNIETFVLCNNFLFLCVISNLIRYLKFGLLSNSYSIISLPDKFTTLKKTKKLYHK